MMKVLNFVLLFTTFFFASIINVSAKQTPGETKRNKSSVPNNGLAANCAPATSATELDINNTRALIHSGGDMWWDLQGESRYEIPKGSGNTSLFSGALWLGGQDVSGQLKVAALRFRSNGNDYWTGPLSTVTSEIDPATCVEWDRHFVSTRDEITQFVAWYEAGIFDSENGTTTQQDDFPNYQIPTIVLEWPAHGRNFPPYDEDFYLAPFTDRNGDGFYNPLDGDYPAYDLKGESECKERIVNVFGDQNLWWLFNDKGNVHTETGSAAIGMEIRAQAFAFATNDEVNNMTFYNYELVNRSTFTLTETYFGQWVDADLGGPLDDYVGCDVMRGLGYCFNGDAVDEDANGSLGYGSQPPAVGVDFFQGPFQDPDGIDNAVGIDDNEALNGVGYGDGEVDNERFGMRRFLYHNNGSGVRDDPQTGAEYYNYLRGIWKDGNVMTYGGTGYNPTDPTAIPADFMFPDGSDPLGWGTGGIIQPAWNEVTAGNTPDDRRFIQSTGPFTLAPGAVNNITVGVAWARATSGGPFASVEALRRADDKTQALFDNCFKILNGPDAPDISIQELDKELILYISNRSVSNNFNEGYAEVNPFLIPPDSVDTDNDEINDTPLTDEEKIRYSTYTFQGYQLYQVKDASVSPADLDNPDLARLIAQCDIKDGVDQLVNYTFDESLGGNIPVEEVDGADDGIFHSFKVSEDLFASGDNRLVNHQQYHFMAIAYAFNNYGNDFGNLQFVEEEYDQNDPDKLGGQKEPYLASRKAATGGIRVFTGIPHDTRPEMGGTVLNAAFGDGVELTRIEGQGNGDNQIFMKTESIEEIFSNEDFRVLNPTYIAGQGPVSIQVIDPLNVKGGTYTLAMQDTVDSTNGDLTDAYWELTGPAIDGAITSERTIEVGNEQLVLDLGISINIQQTSRPGEESQFDNGFLGGSVTYADPTRQWLGGVGDEDGNTGQNWIRSGTNEDPDAPEFNDFLGLDDEEVFEDILGGTWAPFRMATDQLHGPSPNNVLNLLNNMKHLQSVDIVFTSDQSKWTRCPVLEMHDDETQSEGGVAKGFLRAARSVDKNGNPGADGDLTPSTDPNSPNYIAATGMGWFPGYAINVETGERLNMAFGEDSWLEAENGRDMQWNPTSTLFEGPFSDVRFGGKHYIYVFRNNIVEDNDPVGTVFDPEDRMPAYDAGAFAHEKISNSTVVSAVDMRNTFKACMWVGFPMVVPEETLLSNDVTVHLRVSRPYEGYGTGTFLSPSDALTVGEEYFVDKGPIDHDGTTYNRGEIFTATTNSFTIPSGNDNVDNLVTTVNGGRPMYNFNLDALAPTTNSNAVAVSSLDDIRAVPNPYYAYSEYETGKIDNRIKIINLPQRCNIKIYTLNGSLIRTFEKDDPTITSVDWDLKNQANIPIASGMYLIHIEAPGIGEKVLKWFGALRPIDLDSF